MTNREIIKFLRKSKIKIGDRFGRLIVREFAGQNKHSQSLWFCKCDCGNMKIIMGGGLRNGHTKSCGCLQRQRTKESRTTHGMSLTSEHAIWKSMFQRCTNPNNKAYKYYGGHGIKICKSWRSFSNFFEDMGEKPKGLTLERINNNGNYELSNCKWATRTEQMHNQRIRKNNKTGINGICWKEQSQKYIVQIGVKSKTTYIGCFETLEQAKIARQQAEQKYWERR